MRGDEWWREFFDGLALQLWREATPEALTRHEVERSIELAGLARGARVLDVPCGAGRHAIELAARGCEVVGIDQCRSFIDEGRAAARRRAVAVDLRLGDMRELPPGGRFDAVICLGNSFAYMDDAGNRRFLEAASGALRADGAFVLQSSACAESVLPALEPTTRRRVGALWMTTESRFDPLRGSFRVAYTIDDGTVSERRTASYRIYTLCELGRLLDDAGLAIEIALGEGDEPFAAGDEALWLVARRR